MNQTVEDDFDTVTATGLNDTDFHSVTPTDYIYDPAAEPCSKQDVKQFAGEFLPPVYSLVFIFGFLGNAMVILILVKYKRLKSMTDIYLLNLSVSDLLFVLSLPFWAYYVKYQWVFGVGLCKFLSGLYSLGFYSGALFIILLTIDRYLAIVHAVFAFRARTVTYGIITSLVTWGVAILASMPAFIFHKTQNENGYLKCGLHYPHQHMKTWKIFITFTMNILGLLAPMTAMIFCYTKIIKTLSKCKSEKKHKAYKLIFVIMFTFFLFWTPYNIVLLLFAFNDSEALDYCESSSAQDQAMLWTESIAMMHCCLNPIIYAFAGEKFRKYLRKVTPEWVICSYCPQAERERIERQSSVFTQSTEQEPSAMI